MLALGVAALLGLLALVAVAARPRAPLNLALAALLLLRAGVTLAFDALRTAGDAADATALAHATVWYALPVPFLLLVVALELRPGEPSTGRRGALAAGAAATLAALAAFLMRPTLFVTGVGPLAGGEGFGYDSGAAVYALAAASRLLEALGVLVAARGAADPAAGGEARRQRAAIGLAFAFLTVHAAAFLPGFLASGATSFDAHFALRFGGTGIAAILVLRALPSLLRALGAAPRRAGIGILAVLAALGLVEGMSVGWPLLREVGPPPGAVATLARAGFAALVAAALVRFDLAGIGAHGRALVRRAMLVGLAAAVALFLGGTAYALRGGGTSGLSAALLVGGIAVAVTPYPLRRLAEDAAARLLLRPEDPAALAARARTYAAAIEASLAPDGSMRAEGGHLLRELRADLGVTEREHELLLRALASRRAAPPAPAAGETVLGRYRLERELGRGAEGSAHLARDALTQERVVVKRFHGRDADRALAEARALAAVRHPRVVPFREVDRVGDEVFLVMGYAEGGTARGLLDREGPLAPPRALGIALDFLDGLAALHARGLVHRDVKPENVLLDAEGRAMLGDLGSARRPAPGDATLTGSGPVGTLATMAPETLRGAAATTRSDVHMAGATLHRLLTGEHHVALDGVDAFEARERILLDPPRLPHPRVPTAVEAVLRRALAKRPDERYADATQMRAALENTLGS